MAMSFVSGARLSLLPVAAAVVVLAVIGGCADDSNNLTGGGGTTTGNTTGSTTGSTTGGTTGTDPCLTCGGNPKPPGGLADCDANDPTKPYKPVNVPPANVSFAPGGLCISCTVLSPVSAYDGNTNTYAIENASVNLLGLGAITLNGYGPTQYLVPTGKYRTVGLFVAFDPANTAADVTLGASSQANPLDATGTPVTLVAPSQNPPTKTTTITLLGSPVLGLNGQSLAFVEADMFQQPFNGVQLDFGPGLLGALANLNVIEACVQK